jgi:hypothetical protein
VGCVWGFHSVPFKEGEVAAEVGAEVGAVGVGVREEAFCLRRLGSFPFPPLSGPFPLEAGMGEASVDIFLLFRLVVEVELELEEGEVEEGEGEKGGAVNIAEGSEGLGLGVCAPPSLFVDLDEAPFRDPLRDLLGSSDSVEGGGGDSGLPRFPFPFPLTL